MFIKIRVVVVVIIIRRICPIGWSHSWPIVFTIDAAII